MDLGSKIAVACARAGGANATPLFFSEFLAAYFAKRNLNCGDFEKRPVRNPPAFLPRPLLRAGNQPRQGESFPSDKLFRPVESIHFRSKKVRAKDIISPPIETSRFERIAPRGRVAAALRKTPRRFAAKWLGGLNSKRADLSVSYLKTI